MKRDGRFDKQAWLLLLGMVAFSLIVLGQTIALLALPGDGWQIPPDATNTSPPTMLLGYFMGDWATPLQAGDVVTAVDGSSLVRDNQLTHLSPPGNWRDGGTVIYTIERQGESLQVPVQLHRLSLMGILRGLWQAMQDIPAEWGWSLVGIIVFWLRPSDRAARLLFLMGVMHNSVTKIGWGSSTVGLNFAPLLLFNIQLISNLFWGVFWAALILLVLSFPVTIFPLMRWPHGVPWLLFGLPLLLTALTLITRQDRYVTLLLIMQAVMLFAAFGMAIFDALQRSRTAVARAQTLWLSFGLAISIGLNLPFYLLQYAGLMTVDTNSWLFNLLDVLTGLALPVALGIAITRYRLFDITIIIRRTVQYTFLTLLLGLVYFGTIVVLQTVAGRAVGEQSPFIIVLSTLLIAVLFNPLRRRIQAVIDRRFFRKKYDAAQVLAQFAQSARDETNMEALQTELVKIVQESLQPETVSIWLKR